MAVSGPLTHIPMFVVWFAVLGIASHIIYHGAWAVSLTIPDPRCALHHTVAHLHCMWWVLGHWLY